MKGPNTSGSSSSNSSFQPFSLLGLLKFGPRLIAGNSLVFKPPTKGAVGALHKSFIGKKFHQKILMVFVLIPFFSMMPTRATNDTGVIAGYKTILVFVLANVARIINELTAAAVHMDWRRKMRHASDRGNI